MHSMRKTPSNYGWENLLLLVVAEAPDIIHIIAPVCPARLTAVREPIDPLTGEVNSPYGILC